MSGGGAYPLRTPFATLAEGGDPVVCVELDGGPAHPVRTIHLGAEQAAIIAAALEAGLALPPPEGAPELTAGELADVYRWIEGYQRANRERQAIGNWREGAEKQAAATERLKGGPAAASEARRERWAAFWAVLNSWWSDELVAAGGNRDAAYRRILARLRTERAKQDNPDLRLFREVTLGTIVKNCGPAKK